MAGQVAVVAGGTRGAGRAIAVSLGAAGAMVYVTGRSSTGHPATRGRPETIDGTVEMIRAAKGNAVALRGVRLARRVVDSPRSRTTTSTDTRRISPTGDSEVS